MRVEVGTGIEGSVTEEGGGVAADESAISAALAALAAPDAAVRATALRWLGEHATEALVAAPSALFHDPDLTVRENVAVAFRAADDPALVNRARLALRDLVLAAPPARYAGLRAAARLANPTLAPRLVTFLTDPDPETRRLTLLALAAVPPGLLHHDFLSSTARAVLDDADPDVRALAETILRDAENVHSGTPIR